jgi:hypothetical protein
MQVQQRQHLGDPRDLRAHGGKITEENRDRAPVTSSVRLSLTRGALTWTAPEDVSTSRGAADPLRTTSRRPTASTWSAWASTYAATSAQRRRQHPPRTITHDLIEHRPTRRAVDSTPLLLGDYREHRRTFPTRACRRELA